MCLSEYTDEQLREELQRGAGEKHSELLEKEKKKNYVFWEGVVTSCYKKSWETISNRFVFTIEGDDCKINAKLLVGIGFKQSNMPKKGDKVLLRHKIGCGYTCNKQHSKIIEIIKERL